MFRLRSFVGLIIFLIGFPFLLIIPLRPAIKYFIKEYRWWLKHYFYEYLYIVKQLYKNLMEGNK